MTVSGPVFSGEVSSDGRPGGEAVEGGVDGGEVVEGVHAVGAAAEFAGGLGAAQEEEAEEGGLVAAEVEDGADAVLVLGDAGVADGGDEGEVFEGVKGLADVLFGEIEDGIAAGALVAGVEEGVEREGIVLGGGDLFFDEGAEDAELDLVELHIYKGAIRGLLGVIDNLRTMANDELLFINEEEVRAALSYDELIPAIRSALSDFSAGVWCSRCGR